MGQQLMEIEKWRNETDQKLEAVFNITHGGNLETRLPIGSFVSRAVILSIGINDLFEASEYFVF